MTELFGYSNDYLILCVILTALFYFAIATYNEYKIKKKNLFIPSRIEDEIRYKDLKQVIKGEVFERTAWCIVGLFLVISYVLARGSVPNIWDYLFIGGVFFPAAGKLIIMYNNDRREKIKKRFAIIGKILLYVFIFRSYLWSIITGK